MSDRTPEWSAADDCETQILYRTRPYVCGAIGAWVGTTLQRLRAASPTELRKICETPVAALWASAAPLRWTSGQWRGFFWGGLVEGTEPTSWSDAAEQRLAAGLQVADGQAVLHTDALGMHDVYYRRHGRALYFSVRIHPLLDISDESLHTDWSTWANVFAVTAPLSRGTPFQEIRRVAAASGWSARPDGLDEVRFEPTWLCVTPDPETTPSEAVETIMDSVVTRRGRAAITLSGGWDSRMLAVLTRERKRRVVAWTTSNDDGRDNDLEFARQVADTLRLRHNVFVPGEEAWLEEHATVRRRTGFQTIHHVWIMPLYRKLHTRSEQFIDGLAGDVLFKSLFVGEDIVCGSSPTQRRERLWNSLAQGRLQHRSLLAPRVATMFEAMSRESFDEAVGAFDSHPAGATLAVLHTRTARAIASSPQWLLAPEVEVALPFLHPRVIASALRVPVSAKIGGNFYRNMLHAAHPTVAALPSTNDARPIGKRGARRQSSARALQAMARQILADEATKRLLSRDMRLALRDTSGLELVGRSSPGHRILSWASLLGDWRATHAKRLADNDEMSL